MIYKRQKENEVESRGGENNVVQEKNIADLRSDQPDILLLLLHKCKY